MTEIPAPGPGPAKTKPRRSLGLLIFLGLMTALIIVGIGVSFWSVSIGLSSPDVTVYHGGVLAAKYTQPGCLWGLCGTEYHFILKNGTDPSDQMVSAAIFLTTDVGQNYTWTTREHAPTVHYFVYLPLGLIAVYIGGKGWQVASE